MEQEVKIHLSDDESRDDNNVSYSETMRKQIVKEIYYPQIMKDIKTNLQWRDLWVKISKYSDVVSTVLLLGSGSLASFQTIYDNKLFSIGVILCNTVVFTLNKLSTNSKGEAEKLTNHINQNMRELHIDKNLPPQGN